MATRRREQPHEPETPHASDSEAQIIGIVMRNPDALAETRELGLKANQFYIAKYRAAWERIEALDADGIHPSEMVLRSELHKHGTPEDLEAADELVSLSIHGELYSGNVAYQVGEIMATYRRRLVIERSKKIMMDAYAGAEDLLERVQDLNTDLARSGSGLDLMDIFTGEEMERLPLPHGILGDILYENSIVILYGPSGRWKSFIALAMACAIASGEKWLGRPVEQGDVFYVAAEGAQGIGKRFHAWKKHYQKDSVPDIAFTRRAVNLLDPGDVQRFIRTVQARRRCPKLIVIDTLARSMPGADENGGKDGSAAYDAVDRIRLAFPGCCVLVVAHPGKDEGRGIRGWSGFFNNADEVIKVDCPGNIATDRIDPSETVIVHCEKPKDDAPFKDIPVTTTIESWASEDGAEIASSLVIVAAATDESVDEGSKLARRIAKLPPRRREALEALQALPDGRAAFGVWERASGLARQTFKDSAAALVKDGFVVHTDIDYIACLGRSVNRPRTVPSPSCTKGQDGRDGVSIDTVLPSQADGVGETDTLADVLTQVHQPEPHKVAYAEGLVEALGKNTKVKILGCGMIGGSADGWRTFFKTAGRSEIESAITELETLDTTQGA